jgi:YbgC/YbaW family acyl-CoA thioester hydrolase
MGASVTIRRRVHWMDTDAAGHWHHSAAIRWTEDAEAELHRRLGIINETFGLTPRVHIEYDFGCLLFFDDEVEINLAITSVGESSLSYEVRVEREGETAASGRIIIVLIDRETGSSIPWPTHIRELLLAGADPA